MVTGKLSADIVVKNEPMENEMGGERKIEQVFLDEKLMKTEVESEDDDSINTMEVNVASPWQGTSSYGSVKAECNDSKHTWADALDDSAEGICRKNEDPLYFMSKFYYFYKNICN